MLKRRAQVTVFIIIGMSVLFSIALLIYFWHSTETEPLEDAATETGPEVEPVKVFVENCLEETARDGLKLIGRQGGYYNTPKPKYDVLAYEIPYYYYLGEEKIPEIEQIEEELSNYIKDNLPKCVGDLQIFKQFGLEIKTSELEVESEIGEASITCSIIYPIVISNDDFITKISTFDTTLNSPLWHMYFTVRDILSEHKKNHDSVPLSYLTSLSYDKEFTYELTYIDDGTVIYNLISNNSQDQYFFYSFAIRYGWEIDDNEDFYIEPIPVFNITDADDYIHYQVRTNNMNSIYYDYTDLFDIDNKTGLIDYDCLDLHDGRKSILIKAVDNSGKEAYSYMIINVNRSSGMPVFEEIANQTAFVGQEYTYIVKARDPSDSFLTYLDDTDMFDINVVSGEIRFIPESTGNYSIKITAVNGVGHSFRYMRLEVK